MSANGSEALAEAISILLNEWLQSCCVVAGVALVLYDHLTTISREVQLIWGRKWTSVILLFYLNRWITVVWVLSTLTDFLPIATIPLQGNYILARWLKHCAVHHM
ncbi:hypothetical protein OBBRIDRAFT_641024 [Obba rivulosa]|uniref:DUF6533 domain-containing protein n=1 Tax=Obba rivulosa TaxID=1052685 RepID=A0A8E2DT05_9APHY|nr:hypothetical protein OBBRIDRAFT_641024 [Obba rivulosa]